MKATGIVRRIDELGRVVIPKEIRRTQRIRRGDPLEIFTTGDGEVIFKKYSPMGELSGVTAQYVDVLSKCFALTAFVSDRDRILAASGAGRRDLADRSVSQPLPSGSIRPRYARACSPHTASRRRAASAFARAENTVNSPACVTVSVPMGLFCCRIG